MAAPLTKLVEELLSALQQAKETQEATVALAEQIRESGIPELDAPDPVPDSSRAYVLQASLQMLTNTKLDALDIVNEIAGIVLFVRTKLETSTKQTEHTQAQVIATYREQISAAQARLHQIEQSRRAVLYDLRKKLHTLQKLTQTSQFDSNQAPAK